MGNGEVPLFLTELVETFPSMDYIKFHFPCDRHLNDLKMNEHKNNSILLHKEVRPNAKLVGTDRVSRGEALLSSS